MRGVHPGTKPTFEPTREEIKAMCEEIRAEWSEKERWTRMGYPDGRPRWSVPDVSVASDNH